MTVNKLFAFAG